MSVCLVFLVGFPEQQPWRWTTDVRVEDAEWTASWDFHLWKGREISSTGQKERRSCNESRCNASQSHREFWSSDDLQNCPELKRTSPYTFSLPTHTHTHTHWICHWLFWKRCVTVGKLTPQSSVHLPEGVYGIWLAYHNIHHACLFLVYAHLRNVFMNSDPFHTQNYPNLNNKSYYYPTLKSCLLGIIHLEKRGVQRKRDIPTGKQEKFEFHLLLIRGENRDNINVKEEWVLTFSLSVWNSGEQSIIETSWKVWVWWHLRISEVQRSMGL